MKPMGPVFVGLALMTVPACQDGPSKEQRAALFQRTQPVREFEARLGAMARAASKQKGSCPEGALRGAIARTQNRRVLFVDAESLRAAANGKRTRESSPLAFLVSSAFAKRTASSEVVDEKSATEAAFAVVSLGKEYDFLAALDFELQAPKADDKKFHAGELRGTLALFDLRSGKPLCGANLTADSSLEAVKKPGQTPQQAADKDFEMQLRRALEQTFSRMTHEELVLDLG